MGRLGNSELRKDTGGNHVGNPRFDFKKRPTRTPKSYVFALLANIKDPETGERLVDDPAFQAAAGIAKPQQKQVA
jgi:hypothetical protein